MAYCKVITLLLGISIWNKIINKKNNIKWAVHLQGTETETVD